MNVSSANLDKGVVGVLERQHLPQALELSHALQWPYTLKDWQFALDLGHGIAIERGGRLAATALWWPYGEDYASAGMIIVAAHAQRRGMGGALMDELLAQAAGRTIILNSTAEGLTLYTRLGFEPYGAVFQHQAVLARPPEAEPTGMIRALKDGDLAALRMLDRAASGMERDALLGALKEVGDICVMERGGELVGYGCVRPWGRGVVIGPVIAKSVEDARALIASLALDHVGAFVRIDITDSSELGPWLQESGLPKVGEVTSMALGRPPESAPSTRLFALSNQSLG